MAAPNTFAGGSPYENVASNLRFLLVDTGVCTQARGPFGQPDETRAMNLRRGQDSQRGFAVPNQRPDRRLSRSLPAVRDHHLDDGIGNDVAIRHESFNPPRLLT